MNQLDNFPPNPLGCLPVAKCMAERKHEKEKKTEKEQNKGPFKGPFKRNLIRKCSVSVNFGFSLNFGPWTLDLGFFDPGFGFSMKN